MLKSNEHHELIEQFEKDCRRFIDRTDKEDKSLWSKGIIYQDGKTNGLFLVYRSGYAFGKVIGRDEA